MLLKPYSEKVSHVWLWLHRKPPVSKWTCEDLQLYDMEPCFRTKWKFKYWLSGNIKSSIFLSRILYVWNIAVAKIL